METEIRDGLRLLRGLEEGGLTSADCFTIADKADPVIVYFALRYLREKYPANNPASEGVVKRVLELTSTYSNIVAMSKKGEQDIITEWFNDSYTMREFFDDEEKLISLIVEKIEG